MKIYRFLKCSLFIALSGLILCGCSNEESEDIYTPEHTFQDSFEVSSDIMPDIVFIKKTIHNYADSQYSEYQLTFFDKNGRYYVSDDSSVGILSPEKIVMEFEAGNLMNKVKLTGKSCDKEILAENFLKFCNACYNEDYSIVYNDEVQAVESDSVSWYGICYDKDGNIRYVLIHDYYGSSDFYSASGQINEVYGWFSSY